MALPRALAWRFPALQKRIDQHLDDNNGEVPPHVLMSDYERWAESALTGDPQLSDFLEFLEDAYGSAGLEVDELISVSFLEHLPRLGQPGAELRQLVGPRLQQQLRVIG